MGVRIPRITLSADYGEESAFGELSLLSIGYGLRQAWIYAAMFGTTSIFGTHMIEGSTTGYSLSVTFLISIIVFGLTLLISGLTDQRFLSFFVSRKTLKIAAGLTCSGTALLLIPATTYEGLLAIEVISGIMTGVGTAWLILFWGTAFARCDGASIVLNTAVALVVAVAIYVIILQHIPFPFAGFITAALPLFELIILLKKTPKPFSERNQVPIFNPLPVNHGKFLFKFGLPVFIFGIALGTLRHTSIQTITPAASAGSQALMLLASCCATVLILITVLALGGDRNWNRFFRPLIPFIAIAVFFLPFAQSGNLTFSSFFLLIAYMCFEALMWISFAELSQRFRLSPVFVFGTGRGLLALAATAGSLMPVLSQQIVQTIPFGEGGVTIIILLVMVIAYALLPGEREIEALVTPPCPVFTDFLREEPLTKNTTSKKELPRNNEKNYGRRSTDKPLAETNKQQINEMVNHSEEVSGSKTPQEQISDSAQAEKLLDHAKGGRFKAKCEFVANTYLLSRREAEVLFFLAKGHNRAYIQEKLYISEGTAKTHIRHIYRKLNIHTQQELMRLVEDIEAV